jgi:hypothetical protein
VVQLVLLGTKEYKVLLEQLELLEQLDYLEQLVHRIDGATGSAAAQEYKGVAGLRWCNWFCWCTSTKCCWDN